MTDFERMEAKVALLSRRVELLESRSAARLAADADDLAAQQAAEALGFSVDVLWLPASTHPGGNPRKRALARELARAAWSAGRIARVLRVAERTVERWTCRDKRRVGR